MAFMWSEDPEDGVDRKFSADQIRREEGLVSDECVFERGYPSSRCDCGLCSS